MFGRDRGISRRLRRRASAPSALRQVSFTGANNVANGPTSGENEPVLGVRHEAYGLLDCMSRSSRTLDVRRRFGSVHGQCRSMHSMRARATLKCDICCRARVSPPDPGTQSCRFVYPAASARSRMRQPAEIATPPEVSFAVGLSDAADESGNALVVCVDGARLGHPHPALQLREDLLDGVEIGRVRRREDAPPERSGRAIGNP